MSKPNYNGVITSTVTDVMKDVGLTQVDLAEVLNCSQSNISLKLNGHIDWQLRDLVALHWEYGMTFPLPALAGGSR